MSFIKSLLLVFISSFLLISCLPSVKMQPAFYKSKTQVGVIVIHDSISIWKGGGQGLLDIAVSSGRKYKIPLQSINSKINIVDNIHQTASKTLNQIRKNYIIIDDPYGISDFGNFKTKISTNENDKTRYLEADLTSLKNKYNVDHLMVVYVKYGLAIEYYGMIELQARGSGSLTTLIVNLNDNSVLFLNNITEYENLKKKWNTPPHYDNLTKTIQKAVDKAIIKWSTKL